MREPPDARRRPPAEGAVRPGAAKHQISPIVTHRRDAAARVRAQDRHLRIAAMAHQAMPLTRYYLHPKHGFYCQVVEGWVA